MAVLVLFAHVVVRSNVTSTLTINTKRTTLTGTLNKSTTSKFQP